MGQQPAKSARAKRRPLPLRPKRGTRMSGQLERYCNQTAAKPQWVHCVLSAGRARGLAANNPANPQPVAYCPAAAHQWCAASAAGLRPPLTRRGRARALSVHRRPPKPINQRGSPTCADIHPNQYTSSLRSTVQFDRSRSPKSPVTFNRNARSRVSEISGHVRRNTHLAVHASRPAPIREPRTTAIAASRVPAAGTR